LENAIVQVQYRSDALISFASSLLVAAGMPQDRLGSVAEILLEGDSWATRPRVSSSFLLVKTLSNARSDG